MKKELTILLALPALALGACTSGQRAMATPPGHYESRTSTTDAYGTTTSQDTSTDVDVDADGNKHAVVQKKTTRDPKGLFNKSTSKSTEVIDER